MSETKECELCSKPARLLCESDEASLCWDCDEEVHAANFLVAKHCRILLCHVCQSPTPWKAAGPKLGPTVSVCQTCSARARPPALPSASRRHTDDDEDTSHSDRESGADDGEYFTETDNDFNEEEEEEEDGENQVVPWSSSASESPLLPVTVVAAAVFSSSGEDVSFSSTKRTREIPTESEDENGCYSSPNLESDENCSGSGSLLRPLKMQRSNDSSEIPSEQAAGVQARWFNTSSSGTTAIVEKLQRFDQEERDASEMILGLCKLTEN